MALSRAANVAGYLHARLVPAVAAALAPGLQIGEEWRSVALLRTATPRRSAVVRVFFRDADGDAAWMDAAVPAADVPRLFAEARPGGMGLVPGMPAVPSLAPPVFAGLVSPPSPPSSSAVGDSEASAEDEDDDGRGAVSTQPSARPTPSSPRPTRSSVRPTASQRPTVSQGSPAPARVACTCGRRVGTQGRHARACAVSVAGAQRRASLLFAAAGAVEAAVAAEAAVGQSVGPPRPGPDPRPPLPPLEEIVRSGARVRVLRTVPTRARAAFGEALRRTLAALRRGDDAERWQRLFAVARCLLAVPARCEGAPADVVARRCRVWSAGWFGAAGMMFAYTVATYAREVVGPGAGERLEAEPPRLALRPRVTPHDPLSCPVPPRRAAASTALALRGWYARAVAALSASGVAAPSEATLAALRALQAGAPPVERPPAPTVGSLAFNGAQVRGAVHRFGLGAAGGVSGLTPGHLLDAMSVPATQLAGTLADALPLLGSAPAAVRAWLFGATLVPLVKPGEPGAPPKIRPIACGDVLRRAWANLLVRAVAPDAARWLSARRQFGVAVPGGADAIVLAGRLYANRLRFEPDSGRVIVKVDFANAYNTLSRRAMLVALAGAFPALLPYALAAYGGHSRLLAQGEVVESQEGLHQGDPFAPLGFSVPLAVATSPVRAAVPLELEAWFLDDGLLGGLAADVAAFLDALEVQAALIGLRLNRQKCEVILPPGVACPPCLASIPVHRSADDWTLLGSPVGSEAAIDACCRAVADRIVARVAALSALAHPQVVYALLRHCGPWALGVYYARAAGAVGAPAFAVADAATWAVMARAGMPVGTEDVSLAGAPPRFGGLGLRSLVRHAPLAFLAAYISARPYLHLMLPPDALAAVLDAPDAVLWRSLDALALMPREVVVDVSTQLHACGAPEWRAPPHLQRRFSSLLDGHAFVVRLEAATPAARARLMSASAPHAGAWLCPLPGANPPVWLAPAAFVALLAFRLGLPVMDAGAVPARCVFCGVAGVVDVWGLHALSCVAARWPLHNALRDAVFWLAAEANWAPRLEVTPFPGSTLRADIVLARGPARGPRRVSVVDVAVVHPLCAKHLRAAQREPGGAATAYEAVKRAHYEPEMGLVPDGVELVPLVFETFGGASVGTIEFLRPLARAWGWRRDIGPSRSTPLAFARISTAVMGAVGRILASSSDAASAARLPAVPADDMPARGAHVDAEDPQAVDVEF
jgi:hypothetical protein